MVFAAAFMLVRGVLKRRVREIKEADWNIDTDTASVVEVRGGFRRYIFYAMGIQKDVK